MGESDRGRKMFALLILPSAALAWRPAPGIPLERQLPANRQTTGSGSGSGVSCDYDPWTQECNGTEIWCDSGYYTGTSGDQCWYGNYCMQLFSHGCPGICHTPCNWDTEDYCDMGMDENNCWMGNWCQDKSLGGCPSHTGSGSSDYSGSTSTCSEAYTQECNSTELYCDARTRAWGVALHLWEAPSLTPVKISAPTSPPTLRNATALRSPATWVTHLRAVGLATIASTPFNLGTTALACATTCATGRLKNRVTWVWTPMDAGWATGART